MITLPEHVQQGDNWSGSSVDHQTGYTNPNLESGMNFAEHQRIVCAARALLVNMNFSQEDQADNPAKAKLMILKAAYENNDGGQVYISKGIHQPHSNPHIQLRVDVDNESHLFHLDVSAHDVVKDLNDKEYFHWHGARFSATVKKPKVLLEPQAYHVAWWPEGANVTVKSSKLRRNSVSAPMLLKIDEKIEEERAAAKRQSDEQNKRNKVIKDVETKLKLKPSDKFQLAKLWKGEPANFKTSTGKTIACTYDGTHFTHNNGQKLTV